MHSVCAFSAKLEKFTWKQDEGNNSFEPLSSPFVCFSSGSSGSSSFFLFLFSVLLVVPFLSTLSSPSSRYSLFFFVPLPFSVSLLPILCFLTLSLYLSLFSFFSKDFPPSVSFSLCCPVLLPSRSFFLCFLPAPFFSPPSVLFPSSSRLLSVFYLFFTFSPPLFCLFSCVSSLSPLLSRFFSLPPFGVLPPCSALCLVAFLLFTFHLLYFLSPLSRSLPSVSAPLHSSSFSGFYKPMNALWCNVRLGNRM